MLNFKLISHRFHQASEKLRRKACHHENPNHLGSDNRKFESANIINNNYQSPKARHPRRPAAAFRKSLPSGFWNVNPVIISEEKQANKQVLYKGQSPDITFSRISTAHIKNSMLKIISGTASTRNESFSYKVVIIDVIANPACNIQINFRGFYLLLTNALFHQ
ncbi:hypothetical protein IE981_28650 [Klebsiella pneumoniae]|nr:hypothetical protein [Klebsiella pneumoniae]